VFEIVLFEPEIPPNAGNVIRLCANAGARLHLVAPLGFRLDAKGLRRAAMDYAEIAAVTVHPDFERCLRHLGGRRWFACSTRGLQRYDAPRYRAGDVFVFGPETRGLPDTVLDACAPQCRLRIPMRLAARSLNLSNAVAIVLFEAWRQLDFSLSPP
jgi:tRNA (cytidine/uridine-2'-O-)-methyltransferase